MFTYSWTLGPPRDFTAVGWAIAWTAREVLVAWLDEDNGGHMTWHRAEDVSRAKREPPAS